MDQAVVTTQQAPITVPVLLASAPEGQGPPAKMWTSVPIAPRPVPTAGVRTQKAASSVFAQQASNPTPLARSARMWMSVRTTWHALGKSVSTHLAPSSAGLVLLATACTMADVLMWTNAVPEPPADRMVTALTPKAPSAAAVRQATGRRLAGQGPAQT